MTGALLAFAIFWLIFVLAQKGYLQIEGGVRLRGRALPPAPEGDDYGDAQIRHALREGALSDEDLRGIGLDPENYREDREDYREDLPAQQTNTTVVVNGTVEGHLEIRASGGTVSVSIGGSGGPLRPRMPMKPTRPFDPNVYDLEEYKQEMAEWRQECAALREEHRQEMASYNEVRDR